MAFLAARGLLPADASVTVAPLTGGVSSDIVLVSGDGVRIVVKRPLAQLKVAADWRAPVDRSRSEADWLLTVGGLLPGACPQVLAVDHDAHLLALEYLDPATHPLWKRQLLEGTASPATPAAVGDTLGHIHALTAGREPLAERFATDDLFRALRMEPYLLRLAAPHPELAAPLADLVADTMATGRALVHGDVSPKNILVGPAGPVLLDAECAWWGDPAFDLAFVLNHLLLKALLPDAAGGPLAGFDRLLAAYLDRVDWEDPADLARRVGRLLPALLLARVDGSSPVEYLDERARDLVRRRAVPLVAAGAADLAAIRTLWEEPA